jgi:hypothetical protein
MFFPQNLTQYQLNAYELKGAFKTFKRALKSNVLFKTAQEQCKES